MMERFRPPQAGASTFDLGEVGTLVQQALGTHRGLGVQVILVRTRLLQVREPAGQVLLLLLDGLDALHQILRV